MGAFPLPFLQCNVYEFSFSLSSKRTEVGTKVYCHLRSYRRKRYNFIEPVHRYLEKKNPTIYCFTSEYRRASRPFNRKHVLK